MNINIKVSKLNIEQGYYLGFYVRFSKEKILEE